MVVHTYPWRVNFHSRANSSCSVGQAPPATEKLETSEAVAGCGLPPDLRIAAEHMSWWSSSWLPGWTTYVGELMDWTLVEHWLKSTSWSTRTGRIIRLLVESTGWIQLVASSGWLLVAWRFHLSRSLGHQPNDAMMCLWFCGAISGALEIPTFRTHLPRCSHASLILPEIWVFQVVERTGMRWFFEGLMDVWTHN